MLELLWRRVVGRRKDSDSVSFVDYSRVYSVHMEHHAHLPFADGLLMRLDKIGVPLFLMSTLLA